MFYINLLFKKRKLDANAATKQLSTWQHLSSSVEAGAIMVLVSNPLWLIKTRLQLQGNSPISSGNYQGPRDAISTIIREEGYLGLWRGTVPGLLMTSHGAVQFACYEKLKIWYSESGWERSNIGLSVSVSMVQGVVLKMIIATSFI